MLLAVDARFLHLFARFWVCFWELFCACVRLLSILVPFGTVWSVVGTSRIVFRLFGAFGASGACGGLLVLVRMVWWFLLGGICHWLFGVLGRLVGEPDPNSSGCWPHVDGLKAIPNPHPTLDAGLKLKNMKGFRLEARE